MKTRQLSEVWVLIEEIIFESAKKHGLSSPKAKTCANASMIKIAKALGGEMIYFPKTKMFSRGESKALLHAHEILLDTMRVHFKSAEIAKIAAIETIRKTAHMFGGEAIYFPKNIASAMALRNQRLIDDLKNGSSIQAVSRKYDLTQRRIYQILGQRRAPDFCG